jgi:hypothetical protein
MSPRQGSKPRRTDRLVIGRNVTLTYELVVSWGIQLVGVEGSSEKKSVLNGNQQWVDSPETVSGSAGGPGPWRVETQLRGDNQWKHTRTKKISVCVCVCVSYSEL